MKKYLFLIISIVLFFACEDKQEKDCAGVEGGTATVDNCGTCDSDMTNDCTQDCADIFGGTATVDSCGTCDSDMTNDCTQDCAGIWEGNNICGCMDMTALNYESTATFDNNSCEYLSFSYLAGTWNTSAACASSDPNGCDTCEEQPMYECRCEDGDDSCDWESTEALADEASCIAGGGNWVPNEWFNFVLYEDGTAGRPPGCECEDGDDSCDNDTIEALSDATSCVAGGGVWEDPSHDATYSIDGLNVILTLPWGETVSIPFSNNQLTLTVSETPNCECHSDNCDEDTVEALTDAASCEAASGEWEEGYCIVLTLER
jgi:hypothetical protein